MRSIKLSAAVIAACLATAPANAASDAPAKTTKTASQTLKDNAPKRVADPSWSTSVATRAPEGRKDVRIERDSPLGGWLPKIIKKPIRFTADDREAALEAIHYTLTEVADGATFVWHRKKSNLQGYVRATTSFRDDAGSICRHLKFSLRSSLLVRKVEGVACRDATGKWTLDG